MVKLIAIDMDGTLLQPDHTITPRTVRAINDALNNGIHIVVATGRAYYEARDVIFNYDIQVPFINLNGAQIRTKAQELVYSRELIDTQVKEITNVFRSEDLFYQVYTDQCVYTTDIEGEIDIFVELAENNGEEADIDRIRAFVDARIERGALVVVDDYREIFDSDEEVLKFLAKSSNNAKLHRATNDLDEIENITVSSSSIGNLEITHSDAQKGIALERMAEEMGISMKDVMAIGDNLNDVSMIKRAGLGVAMGNATSDVKALADKVTLPNTEDGVAAAIEEVLDELN